MGHTTLSKKDRDERQAAYKSLPPSLRNSLTEEEKELFLAGEVWPESLCDKLSEFIVKSDED
ncbi:hypothetical protein JCM14469_22610 [Desulfatiferula olefinivorans]